MAALSVLLMVSDHRYDYLRAIHYYLGSSTYLIRHAAILPIEIWTKAYQYIFQMETIKQENRQLKESNLELSSDIQKLKIVEQKNARLETLLGSAQARKYKVNFAELISADYTPFKQLVVINRGAKDSVYIGQVLLDAYGVMGQIISVTPISATGMLISDPGHALLAQVDRSGVRVVVAGTGNPHQLILRHVPAEADVREGDAIVTSGLDNRYPPNYLIGHVKHIDLPIGKSFATILLQPAAQLDRAREALLIDYRPSEQAKRADYPS